MAKVLPGGKYGALGNERMTFKKPLECTPPLEAYDETYVRRKQEVAEREQMFTCKSGRKFCYFTDGASDPSVEGVSVVLCLHACGQGRHQFMQREPFANIFQICVDRMGHGKSSTTPKKTGYPFDEVVAELTELIDAVFAEKKIPTDKKLFVIGHSMGATCAIEMAACPDIRDRIAAIAPMSGPADVWNASLTMAERKDSAKQAGGAPVWWMMNCQKKTCAGALGRFLLRNVMAPGLSRPDKDYGCAQYYKGDPSNQSGIKGQGTKESWDILDKDPFYATMSVDLPIPGAVNSWDTVNEYLRLWGAPWSYDPCEVSVPCFIYNGNPEETGCLMAEMHHKMIKGSELIIMEGHGHMSIMMESGRIIEALVKKEKVAAPSWVSSS